MVFFSVDVFFNLKDISNSEPLQHKCTFFRLLIFKTVASFEYQRQFMKMSDKGFSHQQEKN